MTKNILIKNIVNIKDNMFLSLMYYRLLLNEVQVFWLEAMYLKMVPNNHSSLLYCKYIAKKIPCRY